MYKNIILILFLSQLGLCLQAEDIKTIQVRSDEWCPFTCATKNKEGLGILVDILSEATHGQYKIDYRTMNWPRAIEFARDGKINGILGAYHEDGPDFIFPKQYQMKSQDCFYTLNSSNWKYVNNKSFKNEKVLISAGYSYGKKFDDFIKSSEGENIFLESTGDFPLEQNYKKVLAGRAVAFIENKIVFNYYLHKTKELAGFKNVGCLAEKEIYIAFSPHQTSRESSLHLANLVDQFMKDKKKLESIQQKYYLK